MAIHQPERIADYISNTEVLHQFALHSNVSFSQIENTFLFPNLRAHRLVMPFDGLEVAIPEEPLLGQQLVSSIIATYSTSKIRVLRWEVTPRSGP